MCGIIGFSAPKKTTFDLLKLKYLMFYNSVERGLHSTGIFTPKTGTIKAAYSAKLFFQLSEFKKNLKKDNLVIAHVRHATVGVQSNVNAHPFSFGKITGCHNGTLINWQSLIPAELDKDAKAKLDVDSKVLVYRLADDANSENPFQVLDEYRGAAAMLFYNKETNLMYAYRDKERTLYYGRDKNGAMYISSITEPLEQVGIEWDDIYIFEENYLYTISEGKILSKTLVRVPKKLDDLISSSAYGINAAINSEVNVLEDGSLEFIKGYIHTGIGSTVIKAQHLLNYNVRLINCYMNGATATSLTYNKWYYVEENVGDKHVIVRDDWNNRISVPLNNFSGTDFIPVKAHYVRALSDLFTKDAEGNFTVPYCDYNDVLEVIEHKPFTDQLTVKSLLSGELITIHTYWFAPANKDNISKFVEDHPQLFHNENLGVEQNVQTTIDFTNVNNCCGIELANKNVRTEQEEVDDDEEKEFIYVDGEAYVHIIETISDSVKDMCENIESNPQLALSQAADILADLENVKDPEVVNDIIAKAM